MNSQMAKLWSRESGFHPDSYRYAETLEEAGNRTVIVPLAVWLENIASGGVASLAGHGVVIAADEEIRPLVPVLDLPGVIVLEFPVYSDGRAYSKAAQLRNRHGYRGELRARGDILIDQVSNLLRSGFDTLEVRHELTQQRLEAGELLSFPGFYQPGVGFHRDVGTRRTWRI